MTSEGGGKLRQKRSHISKPYDRPKSFLNRVTDAVRNILLPSWVTGLTSSSQSSIVASVDETLTNDDNNIDDRVNLISSRSQLHSLPGSSGIIFPRVSSPSCDRLQRQGTAKPKIPLDGEHPPPLWSPLSASRADTSVLTYPEISEHTPVACNQSSSFFTNLSSAEPLVGCSTSTPCVPLCVEDDAGSSSTKDYHASRRNGERESSRAAASSLSLSTPSSVLSGKRFAKLSDIGKLTEDTPVAGRKAEHENASNLAGDNHSECSEESVSTSGCSSMIPHPDKQKYQQDILHLGKPALQKLSEDLQSSIPVVNKDHQKNWNRSKDFTDESIAKMPSFLWSDGSVMSKKDVMLQPTAATSKPQFKPYLLGSPVWTDKSVLSYNCRSMQSPGKIMYGFGSSYRKARLNSTAPYSTTSSRKQIQVKMVDSGNLDIMSTTAKRILETLEKMSTPVMDAKKIPTNKPDPVLDTPLTFIHSANKKWPSLTKKTVSQINKVETSCNPLSSRGPPVSKLMTPGSVAVTKSYLRNPIISSLSQDITEKSIDTSIASAETRLHSVNQFERHEESKAGGKVRVQKSSMHYSKKLPEEKQDIGVPGLPSVPLPIKNLPVFDLDLPTNRSITGNNTGKKDSRTHRGTSCVSSIQPMTVPSVKSSISVNGSSNNSLAKGGSSATTFMFSSPIVNKTIDTELRDIQQKVPEQSSKFKFSSPIAVEVKSISPVLTSSSEQDSRKSLTPKASNFSFQPPVSSTPSVSNFTFKSPSTTSLKSKPVHFSDADVKSDAGINVAMELKMGSVMDFLSKSSKPSIASPASEKLSGAHAGSTSDGKSSAAPAVTTGFGDKFKPPAGSWECSTCLLHNKAASEKCLACETPKSVMTKEAKSLLSSSVIRSSVSSDVPTSIVTGFGVAFKPPVDTWECPSCMLNFKNDLEKCAACETPKPSSVADEKSITSMDSALKKPLVATSNATGTTGTLSGLQEQFKLVSEMWECDTCLVRNSSSSVKCIACESPKAGISALPVTTSSFKFGFTTQPSSTTPAASSVLTQPSLATSTSSQSTTTSNTVPLFKFGISPSLTSTATVVSLANTTTAIAPSASLQESSVAIPGEGTTAPQTSLQFKFGIPSSTVGSDTSSAMPTFKIPATTMPADFKSAQATTYKFTESAQAPTASSSLPATQLDSTSSTPVKISSTGELDTQANAKPANVTTTVELSSAAVTSTPGWNAAGFKFGSVDQTSGSLPSQASVEKVKSSYVDSVAVTTVTSTAATTTSTPASFTFSSVKPEATNFSIGVPCVTTASTAVAPTTVATAVPANGGFSFRFGTDTSKSAVVTSASAQPSFTFGTTTSASTENKGNSVIPQPSQSVGGFQFTFGTQKRSASDESDGIAKKPALASGSANLPSFGTFSSGGSAAANANFAFGSSTATTVPSIGPVFGALSSGSDKPTASNNFTFGVSGTSASSSAGAPAFGAASNQSSTSIFGSKPVTASPFGATSQPQQAFSFGSAVTKTTASTTFGTAASAPTFTFGLQNSTSNIVSSNNNNSSNSVSSSVVPSFGNSAAAPAAPAFGANASGSVFGSSSTPAFGGFNAPHANSASSAPTPSLSSQGFTGGFNFNPAAANFQFGSQKPDSGIFTFSANQINQQPQGASAGFTFGQQTTTQSTGFNFNPATPLGMNFLPTPANPLELGGNPFDAQATSNRAGRPIRRAKRRSNK